MKPVEVIRKQLTAYNNHALEDFIELFAPNVAVYDLKSSEKVLEGIDQLRERYGDRFDTSPNLYSKLLGRVSLGDIVIDDESISGFGGDNDVRIIAIYEVRDGLITRMWFVRGEVDLSVTNPADLQLKACNSRDIDMFISVFHIDCKLQDLQSGKELLRGRDAMRNRYSEIFDTKPKLNAVLVKRMYLDQFVIDFETVSGMQEDQKLNLIAINEVVDGLITKVWFVRE